MRQFIIHTLVIIFILLIGLSPFIISMIAGSIAEANGCTLHEGYVNPCIIDGEDWGQDLYAYGMAGWAAIATIPLAVGAAILYVVIVVIVNIILALRRRNAAQQAIQETPTPQ